MKNNNYPFQKKKEFIKMGFQKLKEITNSTSLSHTDKVNALL